MHSRRGFEVIEKKWEDEFFEEYASYLDNIWWKNTSEIKLNKNSYNISESFKSTCARDKNDRHLHVNNNDKLRTYVLFKSETLCTEPHLKYKVNINKAQLLAKFRMGVSLLRIETGRYEPNGFVGKKGINIEFRTCKCCSLNKVEDEIHFMIVCPLYIYNNLRNKLFKICSGMYIYRSNFGELNEEDKFKFIFSSQPRAEELCYASANFIWDAFKVRQKFLKSLCKQ